MKKLFEQLRSYIQANRFGVWGTVIESTQVDCSVGINFLMDDRGHELMGTLPARVLDVLTDSLSKVLGGKEPQLVTVALPEGGLKVFLDPILPQLRLVVLGGGHIALPLVKMGKMLDFQVTVVDDRPAFAHGARFPEADQVVCQDFTTAIHKLGFDANTFVIIVTRGHRHDKTCLVETFKQHQAAYIGMIGSRRKVQALMQDLREEGFSEEKLDCVYAPIGLDIGAQTPEEIAVSIMAEIIKVRHRGRSEDMKASQGDGKSGR